MQLWYNLLLFLVVMNRQISIFGLPTVEEIALQCIKETGAKPEELKKIDVGNLSPEAKCFVKCKSEKQGLLLKGGDLNMDGIKEYQKMFKWSAEKEEEVMGCLKKIKPIKTCNDITQLSTCYMGVSYDTTKH